MKQHITLKEILKIENDSAFVEFKCPDTGFLLWPLVRNFFIRFIISDLFYKSDNVAMNKKHYSINTYLFILRSFFHNIRESHLKGPILISATGSHVLRKGLYLNRLADDFAFAAPDKTVLLERFSNEWIWPFPRHNERVFFDAPILTIEMIAGSILVSSKHRRLASDMIDFVSKRAKNMLGWKISKKRRIFLTISLSKMIAKLPLQRILLQRFFKKTKARIFIREEGCYGGSSVLNKIAREAGLITVEYQHGIIHPGHDAYNYGQLLCESSRYRETLPEYFLSYGSWWNKQINAPIKKITIGNPFRTYSIKKTKSLSHKKDIIVLGDGIETKLYLNLCVELEKKLQNSMRVVFRPHPLERPNIQQSIEQYSASNVFFEWDKDVYFAIQTAHVLVSETSTVLFEAIGLVEKIFIWDTPKARFAFPIHPFDVFSSADDLVAKIMDSKSGIMDPSNVEEFWAPNWKENYLAFLQNTCPDILNSSKT